MTALMMASAPVVSGKPTDNLHYAMGGIMSGPIDLSLSLKSGEFSLNEAFLTPGGTQQRHGHGLLDAKQLSRLRKLASLALRKGLEKGECRRRAANGDLSMSMPNMDAIPVMTVRLGVREESAPGNEGCWTKAAEDLAGMALDAARSASQ